MEQNDKHESTQGELNASTEEHFNSDIPSNPTEEKKENKLYKELVEWIKAIIFAVVLVFILKTFLYTPFLVVGDSMEPNFQNGERVVVNVFTYRFNEPEFGDVVVIDVPEEERRFIKRIIGVPGDKIVLQGDKLYINDQLVEEPYLAEAISSSMARGELYNGSGDWFDFPNTRVQENIVPEGYYFVLGDNRSDSTDSRAIGFRKEEDIIGRVDLIMWPLDKLSIVKD